MKRTRLAVSLLFLLITLSTYSANPAAQLASVNISPSTVVAGATASLTLALTAAASRAWRLRDGDQRQS
jgi:hypothetical protein